MKRFIFTLLIVIAAAAGGWFAAHHFPAASMTPEKNSSGRKILFYQSAMHPWIKSDKPGKCTICGMDLVPVYEGDKGFDVAEGMVSLSSNSVTVINVQTAKVERRPLTRTLKVAGVIEDDDSRHRILSAYTEGRIDKLFVNYVGAEVTAGQPLATYYSPMLLTTEREYTSLLKQSGTTGFADLEKEHQQLLKASRLRLRQLGLSDQQIEALPNKLESELETEMNAPMSGTVVSRSAYEGQYIKEGDRLFEIADFSKMWFQFDAYERDLAWLSLGQTVEVTTPSVPGKVFTAKITFIDPTINDPTRSAKVRVEIPNPLIQDGGKPRRELLHRLYAEGVVKVEAPETLVIPRSAVLSPGGNPVVYVSKGGDSFEQRTIKLGRSSDDYWEVTGGLKEGESVVTTGNLLIDAQAQLNQSAHPTEHSGTNTPTAPSGKLAGAAFTETQAKAVNDFLTAADAVTSALSSDHLKAFNEGIEKLPSVVPALAKALQGTELWQPFVQKVEAAGHLTPAADLTAARIAFYPFSTATAEFALQVRAQSATGKTLKIFECPMVSKAVPGAGKTGRWLQLEGTIHNPYYGAEMIDCGTEVKP